MTRTTTGLAAVVLAGALLTACTSGDDSGAAPTSAPASPSSAADSLSAGSKDNGVTSGAGATSRSSSYDTFGSSRNYR